MQSQKKDRLEKEAAHARATEDKKLRDRLRQQKAQKKYVEKLDRENPIGTPEDPPEPVVGENEYLTWSEGSTLYKSGETDESAAAREKSKPFAAWLFQDGPAPIKMNCWEAVLYSASHAGLADKNYIKKAIRLPLGSQKPAFIDAIMKSPAGRIEGSGLEDYKKEDLRKVSIPPGHVVIFGEGTEHVALSTGSVSGKDGGNDHGILELDRTTDGVSRTTIEACSDKGGSPYRKKVSWGPLPTLT